MVISIIAVLIAMLLPALDRARAEAQAVICLSLHKQFGISLIAFKEDNNDSFPPFHPSYPNITGKGCWFYTLMDYVDEDVPSLYQTKTFACPSDQAWLGVHYGGFRSTTSQPPAVAKAPFIYGLTGSIRFSDVNFPSTWITVFDTARPYQFQYTYNNWTPNTDSDADKFPDTSSALVGQFWLGMQYNGARPRIHRDITPVLLVDGHVERMDYFAYRGSIVGGIYEPHNFFRDDI